VSILNHSSKIQSAGTDSVVNLWYASATSSDDKTSERLFQIS